MSSDDPHGHDKEPTILTSPRRFGKGLVIVVAIMAIGAGITIPLFDEMFEIPPPVTQIRIETPAAEEGEGEEGAAPAEEGTTRIAILAGAAVQGSPDYDPDPAEVPAGNSIRSEEHTSELQSRQYLVCRLLLEKKKTLIRYL